LADSFLFKAWAEAWAVVSFTSSVAIIRERLEAYIIADDVQVEDVTDEWQGVAVLGAGAAGLIARVAPAGGAGSCCADVVIGRSLGSGCIRALYHRRTRS
jgi:glycine cleavage system aminomethyltransferase T